MKKHFWLIWLLVFAFPIPSAHADLGFWSAHLVGKWRHPSIGDTYQFRSNATYTFASRGRTHSGFWKIVQPTEKESGGSLEGPVALVLKSRSRTIFEGNKGRVLRSNRGFRIVVDTVVRDGGFVDKTRYWIGGAKWKRVR